MRQTNRSQPELIKDTQQVQIFTQRLDSFHRKDQRDLFSSASLLDIGKGLADREALRLLHLGIQSRDLVERYTQTHFRQITVLDVNGHTECADVGRFKLGQKMRRKNARLIALLVQIDQQIEMKIHDPA